MLQREGASPSSGPSGGQTPAVDALALGRLMLNSMTEGLILLDAAGAFSQWNESAMTLLGLSADELGGLTPLDPRWRAIHEDGEPWPGDAHPVMECLATGRPVLESVMGVHRPDGALIWLTVNARPVFDATDALVGALGVFRDVTVAIELRHRSEALERMALVAAENTTVATAVIGDDGTFGFTNQALATLLGRSQDQLQGTVLDRYFEPSDPAFAIVCSIDALIEAQSLELMLSSRATDRRWVRLHATRLPPIAGESPTLVQMTDITDSRRHLETLSRHEELARVCLDSLDLGVVFASPTLGIQKINRGMVSLLGYGAEELFALWASPSWSMLDADARPIHQPEFAAMQAVDTGEAVRDQIIWMRHKLGHWLRTRCSAVPFGWTDEVVITIADVTADTPPDAPCPERPANAGSRSTTTFAGHPSNDHFDALLAALPDSVTVVADDGTITADRRGIEMDPYPPSPTLIGRNVEQVFSSTAADMFHERVTNLRAGHTVTPFDVAVPAADGVRIIEARVGLLDARHVIVLTRNVTEQRATTSALEHRERELATLTEALPQVIARFAIDGSVVHTNRRWTELTGQSVEDAIGFGYLRAFHPDDIQLLTGAARASLVDGEPFEQRLRIFTASGSIAWVQIRSASLTNAAGRLEGSVATLFDITEEVQLSQRSTLLTEAINASTDPIIITADDGQVRLLNDAARHLLGDHDRLVDILSPTSREVYEVHALHAADRLGTWAGELEYILAGLITVPVSVSMTMLRDRHGRPTGITHTLRDISALKTYQARLDHLAHHDELTGLANRTALNNRLAGATVDASHGHNLGLLFIDLDRFKQVNDDHGHGAGDHVLRVTADRIAAVVRQDDTVFRIGGDEFVVLCERLTSNAIADDIAERIRTTVAQPITLPDSHTVTIGASVGIAMHDPNAIEPDDLIRRADHSMYHAKKTDTNQQPMTPRPQR